MGNNGWHARGTTHGASRQTRQETKKGSMQSGEGDNSQRWRRMEVKLDLLDQRLTRQEGEIFNLREQHREDVKALREEINVLKSAKRKREEDNRRAIIPRSAPRLSHPSPLSRSEPLFFVNEHELLSEHELSSKL